MTLKNKLKMSKKIKISQNEKKELHEDLQELHGDKNVNILKLKNGTEIFINTSSCNYKLKTLDKDKNIFFIKGKDKFFKKGAEVVVAGTVINNALRTFHICKNGRMEIFYDGKVIRTDIIVDINLKTV